jgi:hypothetical protein
MAQSKHKRRSNRALESIAAVNRREERAKEHATMLERHAARKAASTQYERALAAWEAADFKGPAPLDPRFHDAVLFPENFAPIV